MIIIKATGKILEIKNLTKIYTSGRFQHKKVIGAKDISFRINKGEVVSLVGESGSGKTTVANMILRLITPTSGCVYFNGVDITKIKKRDYYKQVQVIFQDPFSSFNYFYKIDRLLRKALNFHLGWISHNRKKQIIMYVLDKLKKEFLRESIVIEHKQIITRSLKRLTRNAFNFLRGSISRNEKKRIIANVLANIGINAEEVLGRYPHQFSGGQLQRFLIARILLIKPILLIADEPTSMIDASARADILNLLEFLRKEEGFSVLFITHDIGQAQYISDRVIVMKNGSIVEKGQTEDVFLHPTHPYTKNLLACVPSLYRQWKFD
ncbi:MAG: ABC transporter ATP-binding protein [Promethearchaeota archaeon]